MKSRILEEIINSEDEIPLNTLLIIIDRLDDAIRDCDVEALLDLVDQSQRLIDKAINSEENLNKEIVSKSGIIYKAYLAGRLGGIYTFAATAHNKRIGNHDG